MESPADTPGERELRVGPEQAGARLDAFLAAALETSRAEARRLLAAGGVRVDGRDVDARAKGHSLVAGTRVRLPGFVPPARRRPPVEPASELSLLAEGPGWVALDKPAGMPVHPYRSDERGSLLGALAARRPEVLGVGEGGLRSGVVHRLDVDTSGVLLFATREDVWRRLRAAFRAGAVEKRYRAIALGSLRGAGELALELRVARHRPARVRVLPGPSPGSRHVELRWRVLEELRGAALVEVVPRTGFLHQIRVALAQLGHPLAGDRAYGPEAAADPSGAPRHLLHASGVRFEEVQAAAPDPPDFAATLAALRI